MKTGLLLEGGAMRGLYTAGVLDVLMNNGITVDETVGVSAGAVFGCNFKSRQYGRTLRYNIKYCHDSRYVSLRSWLTTGDLYNASFCYHTIPEQLDPFDSKTYRNNPMRFFVVCTDVESGKAVYHDCPNGDADDIQWFRASASMPLAAKPVPLEGHFYLDGGIADSIPITWMEQRGYDRILVVLTRPNGYRKEKSALLPALKTMLKQYPAIARAMSDRHKIYNAALDRLNELQQTGSVFIIRPSRLVNIRRIETNPDRLQAMYELGTSDAMAKLADLQRFLSSKSV